MTSTASKMKQDKRGSRSDMWTIDTVGTSEESMKAFIHDHLSGILQPFADRLDFLDGAVQKHGSEINHTTTKAAASAEELEKVRSDLHKTKLQVDSILACQDAKHRELSSGKVAMKKEMQKMLDEIGALNSRQNQTNSDLLDVGRNLKDTDSGVSLLRAALAEVEGKVNAFDFESVDRLQLEFDRLERAHSSTLQIARDTAYNREKDHVELVQLNDDFKYEKHKQEGRSSAINSAMVNLQKRLDQTNHILNSISHDKMAQVFDDVVNMQRAVRQLQRVQTLQETKHLENAGNADTLKASIANLETAVGITDDGFKMELGLRHALRQLQDSVHGNASAIREVGRRCDKQYEELQHGNRRIVELEKIEPHLHVANRQLENTVFGRMSNLEAAVQKQQEMQKYQKEMQKQHESTSARDLDTRGIDDDVRVEETNQLKKAVSKLGSNAQTTEARLLGLESKLSALHDSVVSLRGGVDLTHEYWKGLTKGVQKTHKSVMAEDEMFSTKVSSLNKPLPSLSARN